MYKWPQGRVVRTIGFVIVLVVVADLGYNGAYGQLNAYGGEGNSIRPLVVGGIYASLALAGLIAGLVSIGLLPKTVDFLIDVEYEMARVTWPTQSELIRSTIVIMIMVAVLGVTIFAVDWFNLEVLFKSLYGGGK